MSFIDNLKSLLTLKSDTIRQLRDENDTLKDSVVACRQALTACNEHSFDLEREWLVANQSPEGYYKWARKQVGDITLHTSYWAIVRDDLKALGIRWMCDSVEDSEAFYVDEQTLAKMIPYLSYPAGYASEPFKIDCGDFALWAAADASRIFKVNGVLQLWGGSPYGPHAWAGLQVAEGKYMCWEPDKALAASGKLFDLVNNSFGYKAEKFK